VTGAASSTRLVLTHNRNNNILFIAIT